MSVPVGRGLQIAAACMVISAYAILSHYCNATGAKELGAVLALAPMVLLIGAILRRSFEPPVALLLGGLALAILYSCWGLVEGNFSKIYVLQECALWGLLAWSFGGSLRDGFTPMCTRFADRMHGPLTAQELRYTRLATAAWTIFFATLAGLTVLLFLIAPVRIWSLFSNFATLPLVAAMFAAEYAVRRRALPHGEHRGILATVRTIFAHPP